jgi:hypothetical protein
MRPIRDDGDLAVTLDNAALDINTAWLNDRCLRRREMLAERDFRRLLWFRFWRAMLVLVALGPLLWVGLR